MERQNFNKIKTALLLKCTERIQTNHQHNAVKQIQVILLKKKTILKVLTLVKYHIHPQRLQIFHIQNIAAFEGSRRTRKVNLVEETKINKKVTVSQTSSVRIKTHTRPLKALIGEIIAKPLDNHVALSWSYGFIIDTED